MDVVNFVHEELAGSGHQPHALVSSLCLLCDNFCAVRHLANCVARQFIKFGLDVVSAEFMMLSRAAVQAKV